MKKFLNRKYVFCLIIILFAIFPNTTRAFNFNWKMENFIEKKVIEGGGNTTLECSLNRSGKLAELKLSAEQLKQWKDTKLCSAVGAGYYFFTWQDPGSLLKTEEASINQKECEAKIATKKYPSATECYTTSRQVEIQEYNKSRDPDSMPVNAMKVTNFENDYTLLAPIDNLKGIIRDDIKNPNVECKINNLGQAHIGCYINILLMIAIGLCGGLAVIMIVVRGVQYMGDESVFGKTEAKHHIMAAILGLLLALGAYALLNTVNPDLLGGGFNINAVNVAISPNDTFTGSDSSLCLSKTGAPDPLKTTAVKITLNPAVKKYADEINKINTITKGQKLLMIAQTHIEGFKEGTKAYKTNNPGNIGNTDKAPKNWTCSSPGIKCFNTLKEGIEEQIKYVSTAISGGGSYKINGKYDCALNGIYEGYLYQYLRIYSTGARENNNYLNVIIGYFEQNNVSITGITTMAKINSIK